jgi:hypothetical protein
MRRPSRAAVLRGLKRWARETGIPPRVSDWREPSGKWEREYPAWPSVGDVRAHFETWPQALAAAGLRPHRRAWTREQITRALRAWTSAHGRPPHGDDWERSDARHPPFSTVPRTLAAGRRRWRPPACPLSVATGPQMRSSTGCERSSARTAGHRPRLTSAHARHAVSAGQCCAALLRLASQGARTARLERRVDTGNRRRDPRRASRLHTRARRAANLHRLARRTPAARRVGDHPALRQLDHRACRRQRRRSLT